MYEELTKQVTGQLKSYAVELKQAGFSFYNHDGRWLSPELRRKALELHYCATRSMMSRDNEVELIFNTDNARLLLAAGDSYETFVSKIKTFDLPIKCNAVWDESAVAYRCYTCGLNPCMSMCVSCFEAGHHEGHDYNRFFSSSGGKCDCGDDDVVLESGFCNKHGKKNNLPTEAPLELSAMIEFILIKCVMRLAGTFRCFCRRSTVIRNSPSSSSKCISEIASERIINDATPVLNFLDEIISLASPCIDLMGQILCNRDLYSKINAYNTGTRSDEDTAIDIEEMGSMKRKEGDFLNDVASLKPHIVPDSLASRIKFLPQEELKFECLLDELMFYQARIGYPQQLINFLLKLLPNYEFKIRFAENFFAHYDSIERLLYETSHEAEKIVGSHAPHKIVSRIIHISVQICSSQKMCNMLQEKTNILRRVLESALRMIFHKAKPLDIAEKSQSNPWYGLNLEENAFIESQGYCGATTDLQNLFAHQTILTLFFEDPSAAEEYVLFVSALEGINSLKRIAHGSHIELDNPAYSQRLYQFEMEISIAFIHQTMFIQYDCIKHRFFANFLIDMLKKFFAAVLSDSVPLIFHNNRATFHIPLHRQLAVVCTKYLAANNSLDILPDDPNDLKALISHPLRLQAIISEFFAGMWARNGASMATNVILYLQPSFKIFLDNDLALIRLVAAKLHPYELTRLMYKAYHLTDCLKYCCRVEDGSSPLWGAIVTNKEWVPFMLDGYLKLLLEMVFVRSLAEETMEEELRLQTIHVLALLEKPSYSRIRQYFTYIQQIDDALFEKILNEVAEFVKPQVGTSSQHGHFVLRPEYWLGRVDFIQSKHRASSQREFNTIILRMEKELAKNSPNLGERVPWPYYRLPRLERDDLVFTKTSHILMQPANIYVCRFTFEWYVHGDLSIHLLQEAIYTLNLILKLASLSSADNIELEFLDPDDPVESRQSQISTFEQSRLQFFALFNEAPKQPLYPQAKETDSLTLLLIKLFYKLHGEEFPKATGKTQAAQMLQRMCKMNLSGSDQLIGSGVDYLGRLIAWIFNSDPVSQQLIKDEVFTTNQEASSPTTLSLLERKMAARKRQLELIQQQKMKQSALLKRMADIEGLSDDGMETDQTTKSDIVCSICNDHCDDNNIQKPFGLLIYLQTGSVTEDSTPSPSSNTVIGETQMDVYEDPLEGNLVLTFRDFENDAIPCFYKKYPENTIFSLLPYVEIKTCGHHAHLGCYESYRRTVMMSSYSYHRKLPTPCPLCRTNTSYMLPFASRMEQSVFVGFDEIYLDEDRCFSKLLHHLENATLTATLSPHSLKYYEGLQEKVVKLIISRERLRCSAESVNSVSSMLKSLEKNPPLLPLGLIKNYIDRVTLIEQNDYKFSDRLKGILAEHLFYFACVGAKWEFKSLFASIWAKMDGDKGKFEDLFNSTTTASLLHYDSQSLLIICSAALSIFNLNETARLGLFRVFFKFLLSHCFVRTLAVILLNKPAEKRRQILNALVSANSPLSSTYSQLSDYFLQTQLLNSSYPESTTDVITETINNTVSTSVSKFLQFALNLASELQLVMNVTTPKRDDFTTLFNHCLNMILGQEMQPLEVIRSVNGSNSRVAHWLNDFLPNASNLQACYTETVWEVKRLCQLPNSFDVLFRAYFDQKCPKCKGISAQPMVCLVCGRLLCIESCCDRKIPEISYPINELEQHSNTCCSGSACFLNVTSTMVVLYHMRSVSLFFSPYLDKHFEEDRNLRRGKSLTISQERFEKLQKLWLTHDFERNPNTTNLFPVDKLSEILKKCHNL